MDTNGRFKKIIKNFRPLYPPLSHYLLLKKTRKTLVIKDNGRSMCFVLDFVVTYISNKMTLFMLFHNY